MRCAVALGFLPVLALSGCIVGQQPGTGRCLYLNEATTGAPYWLYLPEGYDQRPSPGEERPKHPLVMTFHGMKPFDSAGAQIREWQQEADRYGFVVCAPMLLVSDLTGPLPLSDPNHPSLKEDERHVVAIMDELYRTVDVNPNKVLATSWSYGGYIAHYMANRYPERFLCIAVKQSNFNEDILDPSTVPRYRDHKVAIYYTENDFAICRRESQRAAEWYAQRGFDLTFGVFEKKGHERTPSVAAEFFAAVCGVEAKTPPLELARMQMKLVRPGGADAPRHADNAGLVSSAVPPLAREFTARGDGPIEVAAAVSPYGDARRVPLSGTRRVAGDSSPVLRSRPVPPAHPTRVETGASNRGHADAASPQTSPVRVRVSSTLGVAPMSVSYSAILPRSIGEGASLLWTENGEPLSNGVHGQKVFTELGPHVLEVLVIGGDGTEYRASRTITVLDPAAIP